MDKNGSDILSKLGAAVSGTVHNGCPSPEDLAVLVEGKAGTKMKKELLDHIGSCDSCAQTYMSMLELTDTGEKKGLRLFTPLSIAATVFIALAAFVVFFKVNIGVKDNRVPGIEFAKTPAVAEAKKEAHRADKKVSQVKRKRSKKGKKGPAVTKSKEVEEIKDEALEKVEAPAASAEPAGIPAKRALQNTQGINMNRSEPPPVPMVVAMGSADTESSSRENKSLRVSHQKKKGSKGLVDRIIMEQEAGSGDRGDGSCFKSEGGRYLRKDRFLTELPLQDNPPELLKIVHPADRKGEKEFGKERVLTLEVFIDGSGKVERACIAAGSVQDSSHILGLLGSWEFRNDKKEPSRFRLVLKLDSNGRVQILNKN